MRLNPFNDNVTLSLAGLSVLVGLWLLVAARTELQATTTHRAETSASVAPTPFATADRSLEDFSQYREIVTRPLLIPTRRPAAAPLAVEASPAAVTPTRRLHTDRAQSPILIGVAIAGVQKVAIVKPVIGAVESVSENEQVAGWTVRSITPAAVEIQRGVEQQEITLTRRGNPSFSRSGSRTAIATPVSNSTAPANTPVGRAETNATVSSHPAADKDGYE